MAAVVLLAMEAVAVAIEVATAVAAMIRSD